MAFPGLWEATDFKISWWNIYAPSVITARMHPTISWLHHTSPPPHFCFASYVTGKVDKLAEWWLVMNPDWLELQQGCTQGLGGGGGGGGGTASESMILYIWLT
jgi:hypothetical protein